MKKFFRQAKKVGLCFKNGFLIQLGEPTTYVIGSSVGLYQGLKYTGSVKRGATAGGLTILLIGAANGVRTIFSNREYIKEA